MGNESLNNNSVPKKRVQVGFKRINLLSFINVFISSGLALVTIILVITFRNEASYILYGILPIALYAFSVPTIFEIIYTYAVKKVNGLSFKDKAWQRYILSPILLVVLATFLIIITGLESRSGPLILPFFIVLIFLPIVVAGSFLKIYLFDSKQLIIGFNEYKQDAKTIRLINKKDVELKYYMNDDFAKAREELAKDYGKYLKEQEAIKKQEYDELHKVDTVLEHDGKSVFDGHIWQYLGWRLLGNFLAIITLGLCYPVKVNLINRWEVQHTVINGRRLSFDGKAIQLFGKWILWWLLTILTLGIYALFIPIKIKSWEIKHSNILGGKEGVESHFNGNGFAYLGMKLLTGLIKIVTLGILTPVASAMMMKWECKHTTYNGYHICFVGNGLALMGQYILWFLLGIVTLGIFFLVIPLRLTKWRTKNTCLLALKQEASK